MGRKKKGTKKSDDQAGGDASAGHPQAPGPSAPGPSTAPQAGVGAGDTPQNVQKSQGTRSQQESRQSGGQQKSLEQQRISPPDTQPTQGAWGKRGTQQQQRTSPPETQPVQGAWPPTGKQQQRTSAPEAQTAQRSWQPTGKQQQRTSPPDTQPTQGGWGKRGTQQQQKTSPPETQPVQGAWPPTGKQQQRTSAPEAQTAQRSWQPIGTQQQPGQWTRQTKGGQQHPHEQQRTSTGGPRQAEGTQQQSAWQTRGKPPQSYDQQRAPPQDARSQQGQGHWPTRDQQQQSYEQQRHPPHQQQGHPQHQQQRHPPHQQQGHPPHQQQQQQGIRKSTVPQQGQPRAQSLVKSGSTIIPEMEKMSVDVIRGTKGRRIQVETNHLRIDFGKLQVAYHYDVQITPDTPKRWLRYVFEEFRKIHFPTKHPAFDGKRNMYSPSLLVEEHQEISGEIELAMPQERTKTYKVSVQLAATVDLSPLRNMRVNSSQQALQCVEIVLRSAPSKRCIQAGRSFFTRPPRIIELGEGCEMYYGHYQSVIRGWKPFFNVDVAHKAFPKKMNVVDLIAELMSDWRKTVNPNDLKNSELDRDTETKLSKHIKGLRISYEIPGTPSSRREYRVNGVSISPRKKIFPVENRNMSIEEYFQTRKNYKLYFPLLPTLWVGSATREDKILLPVELCTVVEGQAINRKMTENQTSAMIKHAATSTEVRKGKIMSSLDRTDHNSDACIREFGFSINKEFEKIEARVLDPPTLEYKDGASCRVFKGTWKQDNNQFLKGAELPSWIIISTCGNLFKECQNLANMISNYGAKMGMRLTPKPGNFDFLQARFPTQRDVSNILQKYSQQYSLIFVIISDSGPIYSHVKKAAEITLNCLTQCIKRKTLMKMNPSTVGNILLKVNSKLNGTNHCLKVRPKILDQPCMIMGADVTHPSPDARDIPSVVAVTASHDPRAMFGYNMCCRLQLPTVEIIEDLQAITREHLLYFYRMNNQQKPYRIIFFRDGVSEGQFAEVKQKELAAIRRACTALEAGYEPKITFIVVQKRHHTRFFPQAKDSEDRNLNVPAGTCVDTMITSLNMQDFYLVSHASIQGVAKPTKYSTLWDDNDMSFDDVEQLAYYLCHLFSRCNRSVSYPAPTYYAHLGAARAKVYIENETINLQNLGNEQRKLKNDVIRQTKPMFFV